MLNALPCYASQLIHVLFINLYPIFHELHSLENRRSTCEFILQVLMMLPCLLDKITEWMKNACVDDRCYLHGGHQAAV
ncbi:hypothetical protein P3S67_011315 [Capsicum chacoense]